MKVLVDMNLSPAWCETFAAAGHYAAHWSAIGDPRASDEIILSWAKSNGFIVFTHDVRILPIG